MAKILLYWHTLRFLKPVQIFARIKFRFYRPRVYALALPSLRERPCGWLKPISKYQSMHAPDVFEFLGERHTLRPCQWDSPKLAKLWRYNLHYFDDLNARGASQRYVWHLELLMQWVKENPPTSGTAWEPYPVSLRIVNWIKWSFAGNTLPSECVQSLALQARWLSSRLEYHILGNHLFSNAKALVFAGSFFCGREADQWMEKGMKILAREIPEQILADGGHFERSPMYHALVLEDMFDLVNLTSAFPDDFTRWHGFIDSWLDIAREMGLWLKAMTHPDGEISFFNDSTMGIVPPSTKLYEYGSRLDISIPEVNDKQLIELRDSGYFRVAMDDCILLLDAAPVGPDYLPGHAHADTLCFECSLFGHRLFVNSGISCYGNSPERLRQRGTAAHNTVIIDAEDSSEVWGGFRVARRARPRITGTVHEKEQVRITALHDGYRRLAGQNQHTRSWIIAPGRIDIEDQLEGVFNSAEARFHLHPDASIDENSKNDKRVIILLPRGENIVFEVEGGSLRVEPSSWHPGFGMSLTNVCLVVVFRQSRITTSILWR